MSTGIFRVGERVKVISLPAEYRKDLETAETKKRDAITPQQKEVAQKVVKRAERFQSLLNQTVEVVSRDPVYIGVKLPGTNETIKIAPGHVERA